MQGMRLKPFKKHAVRLVDSQIGRLCCELQLRLGSAVHRSALRTSSLGCLRKIRYVPCRDGRALAVKPRFIQGDEGYNTRLNLHRSLL